MIAFLLDGSSLSSLDMSIAIPSVRDPPIVDTETQERSVKRQATAWTAPGCVTNHTKAQQDSKDMKRIPRTECMPDTSPVEKECVVGEEVDDVATSFRLCQRWFLVGENDKLCEMKSIQPPAEILEVNPCTCRQLTVCWSNLFDLDNLALIIKSKEMLQFPAQYAVWSTRKIRGLVPFDAKYWYEEGKANSRRTPDATFLYGLSSSGPFGSLYDDVESDEHPL